MHRLEALLPSTGARLKDWSGQLSILLFFSSEAHEEGRKERREETRKKVKGKKARGEREEGRK